MKTLFLSAATLGFLCYAQDAAASDGPMTFNEIFTHPAMRVLLAALVMAVVESLKQWKWLAEKALNIPLARAGAALLMSMPPAIIAWSSSGSIDEALGMLLTTWVGSMGFNGLLGAAVKK